MLFVPEKKKDLWNINKTICRVHKTFEGVKNLVYDDGIYISYVNTAVNDGSEIADLMRFFKTADPLESRIEDIRNIMDSMNCSAERAMDILKISSEARKKFTQILNQ